MKKKRLNPVKTILLSLLALFVLWNLAWLAYSQLFFGSFASKMEKDNRNPDMRITEMREDGWTWTVFRPHYLSFGGNLAVGGSSEKHDPGLIIWPSLFGKHKYGVVLNSPILQPEQTTIDGAQIIAGATGYSMYIDKDGNPTDDNTASDTQEVWETRRDEVYLVLEKAREVWGDRV